MTEPVSQASDPHACPFCEARLGSRVVKQEIPFTTPKGKITLTVDVPYDVCEACGHEGFGEAGERARTEAVYRHLGRVTPWEIVDIRKRLGLTQLLFAEWLGVGSASLERWERGAVMHNQSMDNLIVLLSDARNKCVLDSHRNKALRAVTSADKVVDFSRFQALKGGNESELLERSAAFILRIAVHA